MIEHSTISVVYRKDDLLDDVAIIIDMLAKHYPKSLGLKTDGAIKAIVSAVNSFKGEAIFLSEFEFKNTLFQSPSAKHHPFVIGHSILWRQTEAKLVFLNPGWEKLSHIEKVWTQAAARHMVEIEAPKKDLEARTDPLTIIFQKEKYGSVDSVPGIPQEFRNQLMVN